MSDIHDYAADGDTETFEVITGVTAEGCVISEREYAYQEEDTLEIKTGIEITLAVPQLDLDDQVYVSLEELRAEAEDSPTAEELTLVED